MAWEKVGIWVAVVLLVDASIGLWFAPRLQPRLPRINVVRLAAIEAGAALVLVAVHFLAYGNP
jgi:hypothetical protein